MMIHSQTIANDQNISGSGLEKNSVQLTLGLSFILLLLTIPGLVFSQTYYSRQSGNWNDPNTWSMIGCGSDPPGGVPVAASIVEICNGHTVTLSLAPGIAVNLIVHAGGTLNISTLAFTPTTVTLECGGSLPSTITGTTGTMTPGGNITVNDIAAGNAGAVISCRMALGANRTISVADNPNIDDDLTISQVISGAFGITKEWAGTMKFSAFNTYSGTTTINGGKLQYGVTNALSSGAVIVGDGAVYDLNGFTDAIGALTVYGGVIGGQVMTGTGILTLGGTVTSSGGNNAIITGNLNLGSVATRIFTITAATDVLTISAQINETVTTGITKLGNGTLIMSGNNSYTGTTSISAGILKLGASGTTPNSPLGTAANPTIVASAATLDLNGFTLEIPEGLTLNGNGMSGIGNLINSSVTSASCSGTITLSNSAKISPTGNITLGSNGITGSKNLTKEAVGKLNLGTGPCSVGTLLISAGEIVSTTGTLYITGNFSNSSVFTHNNGTVLLNAPSAAQQILGTKSSVFNNLVIDNALGVTLGNNETVDGILTLTNGRLALASFNLTLNSAAVAGEPFDASRMIVISGTGELRRKYTSSDSYTFPVGEVTGTAEYSPITLNFTSGDFTGAYVGVRVLNSKHINNASTTNYLNRYWRVVSSGITTFSCDVKAEFNPADVAGGDETLIAAGKYNGSLPWIKYSQLGSNTLTANGITSFSDFTGITKANPTVSITAIPATTVCQNTTVTLTAVPVGDGPFTYLWSTGATTASITPPTAFLGTTSYSVTVTDGNGFTATTSVDITVTTQSVPNPTITGPTSVCTGPPGYGYTTEAGMTGYVWAPTGGIVLSGQGTNSAVVQWNASGTRTLKVTYTNGGCTVSTTISVLVTSSLPILTGPSSSCFDASELYSTDMGMVPGSYIWEVPNGNTIVAGGGPDDYTCTVKWNVEGSQWIKVSYSSPVGCTMSTTTVNVTVWALPVPTLNGPAGPFCGATSGNTYTTEAGMKDYIWQVSSGNTIASGGGINDNTITIDWNSSGYQWLSVNYTENHGLYYLCSAASPTTFQVTVNPVITITGPTPVYEGSTGNVYFTEPGMSNYNWSVSAGGIVTSGGGTGDNSVEVTWTNAGNQTVSVSYTDGAGCSPVEPFVYLVSVLPNPPVITCPDDVSQPTNPGLCFASLDPGFPALISGTPPVTYSWEMSGSTVASGTGPILPNPFTFNEGVTTIHWIATNAVGTDDCFQTIEITDDEPPIFTTPVLAAGYCVVDIQTAIYNPSGTYYVDDLSPVRPDYYTITSGNTLLDLTGLSDNCPGDIEIFWEIDYGDDGSAELSGPGQISDSTPFDLPLGNNRIRWTVTDANGVTATADALFVVLPRPDIQN